MHWNLVRSLTRHSPKMCTWDRFLYRYGTHLLWKHDTSPEDDVNSKYPKEKKRRMNQHVCVAKLLSVPTKHIYPQLELGLVSVFKV